MTIEFRSPSVPAASAWPREARMQCKPHGQRWGEGLDSVLDHLHHDRRHQPHPAGAARRGPQRERKQ